MYVRDAINNKNVSLEVDGSNQLSVKDATAQGSLSAMNGHLSTLATVVNSAIATATATTIPNTIGTGNSSLSSIDGKLTSQATASKQADIETAVNAVNSTLAGTITVSSSAPARASGSLAALAIKASGDLSSSVNGTNYRKAAIFGSSSSNSAKVRIHVSHDNTNFYEDHQNQFFANASNGHIAGNFELNAPYFKVEFVDGATYSLEYSLVD